MIYQYFWRVRLAVTKISDTPGGLEKHVSVSEALKKRSCHFSAGYVFRRESVSAGGRTVLHVVSESKKKFLVGSLQGVHDTLTGKVDVAVKRL